MRHPQQARRGGAQGGAPLLTLDIRRFHEDPVREMVALARHLLPAARVRTGGGGLFLHLCHPDTARHVLQTNGANYLKDFSPFASLVGDSLLAANGEKWRALRSRMQPAFAPSRLRHVVPQAVAAADRLMQGWQPALDKGGPVDVMPGIVRATLEFIVTTLFTLPAATIEPEDIDAIAVGLEQGGRMMHFGGAQNAQPRQKFKRAIERFDSLAARIVAARRAALEKPDDLLTLLIDALDDPGFPEMTEKQIRDDILTFLFAGHETTATALGWTLRLISRHPSVQEKMHDEIAALGDRAPEYDDLKRLPYTTAVFTESLRMRPPVPLMIRVAADKDRVGDIDVAAGMRVAVSVLGIHHHPSFWPDPARFDPERFTGTVERQPGSFLAFSAGSRSCIGSRLAMIEAPVILARVLQRLRLLPATNPPMASLSIITLRPRDGQFVRLERRH
jgi:cytochrome P450